MVKRPTLLVMIIIEIRSRFRFISVMPLFVLRVTQQRLYVEVVDHIVHLVRRPRWPRGMVLLLEVEVRVLTRPSGRPRRAAQEKDREKDSALTRRLRQQTPWRRHSKPAADQLGLLLPHGVHSSSRRLRVW